MSSEVKNITPQHVCTYIGIYIYRDSTEIDLPGPLRLLESPWRVLERQSAGSQTATHLMPLLLADISERLNWIVGLRALAST